MPDRISFKLTHLGIPIHGQSNHGGPWHLNLFPESYERYLEFFGLNRYIRDYITKDERELLNGPSSAGKVKRFARTLIQRMVLDIWP